MPFKRVRKGVYRSPSGRRFTLKQVRLYYVTKGFRRKAKRKK